MKKLWSYFLVMLCILMIMVGCDSKEAVAEEESDAPEAQSESLLTDENSPPSTPQAPSPQDPPEEDDGIFEIAHYKFYKNSDGELVVERWSPPNGQPRELVETKCFAPVTPTAEDFANIKKGMNIYEVVELVGLPTRNPPTGIRATDFECEDGVWQVQWHLDRNTKILTVLSVSKVS